MKLPDPNIRGVQSLGRHDISAPLRVAAAEGSKTRAQNRQIEQVSSAFVSASDAYIKLEYATAEAEANKALMQYTSSGYEFVDNVPEFDEEGKPVWSDPNIFDEGRKALEEEVTSTLSSDLARELFERNKYKADSKIQYRWNNKVTDAKLRFTKTTTLESLDSAVDTRDWPEASNILQSPVTRSVLTPREYSNYKSAIALGQRVDSYSNQLDSAAMHADQAVTLKERIRNDEKLPVTEQNKLIAALELKQRNLFIEAAYTTAEDSKQVGGLRGAVSSLDVLIDQVRSTDPEDLGGGIEFKLSILDGLKRVRADYVYGLKRKQKEKVELTVADSVLNKRIVVSPRYNTKEYDTTYKVLMGGTYDTEGKFVEVPDTEIFHDDSKMDLAIALTKQYGFMPPSFERMLGAYAFNGTPEERARAIQYSAHIYKEAPNLIFSSSQNSYMKELFGMIQTFGMSDNGIAQVAELWEYSRTLGPQEKQMWAAEQRSPVFSKTVNDNFNKVLKQEFPVVHALWFNTTPDVQKDFKLRVARLAGQYLPLAKGDANLALRMAMNFMKTEYGVTSTFGKPRVIHFPPGQVMSGHTNLPPQVNDSWITEQVKQEVREAQGDSNYDTDYLDFIPVPDFDPTDPKYILVDKNPRFGGMPVMLHIYKPVFEDTEAAKKMRIAEQIRAARAKRNQELAVKGAEWAEEHKEELEDPTISGKSMMNPYTGLLNRGKLYIQDRLEDTERAIDGFLSDTLGLTE